MHIYRYICKWIYICIHKYQCIFIYTLVFSDIFNRCIYYLLLITALIYFIVCYRINHFVISSFLFPTEVTLRNPYCDNKGNSWRVIARRLNGNKKPQVKLNKQIIRNRSVLIFFQNLFYQKQSFVSPILLLLCSKNILSSCVRVVLSKVQFELHF